MFHEPSNFLPDLINKLVSPPNFFSPANAPSRSSLQKKSRIRPTGKKTEAWYRDKLAKTLGGQTEVVTPDGRIDILTDTQVIEVKAARQWKHALGQILVYGAHYPYHQKRIHLFGEMGEANLAKARQLSAAKG